MQHDRERPVTSLEFGALHGDARRARGLHRGNIGRFYRISGNSMDTGYVDEARPPFEDDVIRYYGQYVAVVIADTFEEAKAAAAAVEGRLRSRNAARRSRRARARRTSPRSKASAATPRGASTARPSHSTQTNVTPETHNPIELHATVAHWDGESYTFYETTQGVVNHRN